ncbi:hypothetical protein ACFYZJ_17865 [Streptomyces sp. NPDC001848]|uniref:hypothetical protein n=1 Tax=Streptomyces sp. NPDC001848 TaxID=3364618 RepID=UPI003679E098
MRARQVEHETLLAEEDLDPLDAPSRPASRSAMLGSRSTATAPGDGASDTVPVST